MQLEQDAKSIVAQLSLQQTGNHELRLLPGQKNPQQSAHHNEQRRSDSTLREPLPQLPRITSAALRAFSEEHGFALGLGVYEPVRDSNGAAGYVGLFEVSNAGRVAELRITLSHSKDFSCWGRILYVVIRARMEM